MLRQWQHVAGLAAGVAGTAFTAAFGGELSVWAAYALAVALGLVLYEQGDTYAAVGTVAGNVLVGYLAGIVLSFVLATGLLIWLLNAPWDFAGWQVGLMMWDSWAGIGVAVLSGFFVAGLAAPLR
jgi:drug/metabolite transporter (DMT)-like permease